MDVVVFFSIAIRFATEIHNYMASFQKIYQYTQMEQEDDLIKPKDKELQGGGQWPHGGVVDFNGVSMRYRETMAPSLKGLSFTA